MASPSATEGGDRTAKKNLDLPWLKAMEALLRSAKDEIDALAKEHPGIDADLDPLRVVLAGMREGMDKAFVKNDPESAPDA